MLAGEVITLFAEGVGRHQVEVLLAQAQRQAPGLVTAEAAAATGTRMLVQGRVVEIDLAGRETRHAAERLASQQGRQLRIDGVVAGLHLQFTAEALAFQQDVVHVERLDLHRAAHRGVGTTQHRRALDDLHAADQAGIDVVAVIGAHVATPDRQCLLGAIDGQRHPARALDAADVRVQRAAVAGVAAVDVDHALEDVGRCSALVAFDLLAPGVDGGQVQIVDIVVAALIALDAGGIGRALTTNPQRTDHHGIAVSAGHALDAPRTRADFACHQIRALQQPRKRCAHRVAALQCGRSAAGNQCRVIAQRNTGGRRGVIQCPRQRRGREVEAHIALAGCRCAALGEGQLRHWQRKRDEAGQGQRGADNRGTR